MTYFDDLQILNALCVVSRGGDSVTPDLTVNHYLGVITGCVRRYNSAGVPYWNNRPVVYFTPAGIRKITGWQSPPGRPRENSYIELSGSRADRIMAALMRDFPHTEYHRGLFIDSPEPYLAILEEIRNLFERGDTRRNCRITLLVEEFVALMYEQLQREESDNQRYKKELTMLMERINGNPGVYYDFKAMAAEWNLSYDHFRKLFSKYTGWSPHDFLLGARLRLALRRLADPSGISIKQIADECGFSGASEFSRFFRGRTGMTPSRYQWMQRIM